MEFGCYRNFYTKCSFLIAMKNHFDHISVIFLLCWSVSLLRECAVAVVGDQWGGEAWPSDRIRTGFIQGSICARELGASVWKGRQKSRFCPLMANVAFSITLNSLQFFYASLLFTAGARWRFKGRQWSVAAWDVRMNVFLPSDSECHQEQGEVLFYSPYRVLLLSCTGMHAVGSRSVRWI